VKLVLSVENPVETDSEGIHVCLVGIVLILEDLRGHVEWRAEHGFGPAFLIQDFGESEVSNFDNTIVPEDIGELEIAVDDFVFVEMMKAVNQLTHDGNSLIFDKILFLFEVGIQIAIIAILEHKVVVVIGLFHVIEFDDVGALTAFEHFDFAFEQFLELA
jgi:hypothetical protein